MGILEIIGGVLLILCSIVIVLLVTAQQPNNGMGAISGGSDMFGNMQSRSADARIANVTKYAGVAFFVLAIAVSAINIFAK